MFDLLEGFYFITKYAFSYKFCFSITYFFNICNGQANQLVVVNIGEGASYLGVEKDSDEVMRQPS